jgi:serine/threonine protein kinase
LVTPAYRNNFFFRDRTGSIREKDGKWFTGKKARRLLPDDERGNLLSYLQVCTRMARAVRRLHFAGLAHSDLSNKNVLIDPKGGDACVIDIDSLVVPQVAPPSVIGTPGYIAPEVLASGGKILPSIATDKHALAVLIYETLLQRHPLRGKKTYAADPVVDEELSMGKNALFIEHPTNRGNPPEEPITFSVARLGNPLLQLFNKTFVEGLHEPGKRADAAEWERALYQTLNMVCPLPSGRDWMILAPGLPLICPLTGERFTEPVPYARFLHESRGSLVDDKQTLTIWHNQLIQAWHVSTNIRPGENADRAPLGYFSFHQGQWWAVNTSGNVWTGSGSVTVEKGKGLVIQPGLQVKLAPGDEGRVLAFDFLKP